MTGMRLGWVRPEPVMGTVVSIDLRTPAGVPAPEGGLAAAMAAATAVLHQADDDFSTFKERPRATACVIRHGLRPPTNNFYMSVDLLGFGGARHASFTRIRAESGHKGRLSQSRYPAEIGVKGAAQGTHRGRSGRGPDQRKGGGWVEPTSTSDGRSRAGGRLVSRRSFQVSALAALVLAGNGPFVGDYAVGQYQDWEAHRLGTERRLGRWDIVGDSHTNTIHGVLLRTGKVLLAAGSGNKRRNFDEKIFRTVLWDPGRNTFEDVYTPWDVFCAGHTILADGRVLFAGGTKKYEILKQDAPDRKDHQYQGLKDSYLFDPGTESYQKVGPLNDARWYPSLVTLPNGWAIALSGLDDKGNINPGRVEVFDPAVGTWAYVKRLHHYFPTYPSLLLMGDGRLFFSGANAGYGPATAKVRQPGLWNLWNNEFQPVPGLPQPEVNEAAATVFLPPAQHQRVMVLGGGGVGDSQVVTARTAIADLSVPEPAWTRGPDLLTGVRYPGAVVLPDDTVLVTNGSRGYRARDAHTAQIYHTATNTFVRAASPKVGRDYHAEYLLLPDGRVGAFGSNPLSTNDFFETRVEVYSPPYLFRGPRPIIHSVSEQITRGQQLMIDVSTRIAAVRLIRPASYTHVTDNEQRSVALDIVAQRGGTLAVNVPASTSLLPPAWYMLFVVDPGGVPSTAAWVHVQP
jgi:hypothetical protein